MSADALPPAPGKRNGNTATRSDEEGHDMTGTRSARDRMTHDEAIVRAELRALVEDYATITDALNYDAWVDLFLPEAEFSSTNPLEKEPFYLARGQNELKGYCITTMCGSAPSILSATIAV